MIPDISHQFRTFRDQAKSNLGRIGTNIEDLTFWDTDGRPGPLPMTILPNVGRGRAARKARAKGIKTLVQRATGKKYRTSKAMGAYENWIRANGITKNKVANIDRMASHLGRDISKYGKAFNSGRNFKSGGKVFSSLDEMAKTAFGNAPKKLLPSSASTAKYGILGGTAHGRLLNRRTIISGLAVLAGPSMLKGASDLAIGLNESYRTRNVGSGRFGTDTKGKLGPVGFEGVRFRSYSRSRKI